MSSVFDIKGFRKKVSGQHWTQDRHTQSLLNSIKKKLIEMAKKYFYGIFDKRDMENFARDVVGKTEYGNGDMSVEDASYEVANENIGGVSYFLDPENINAMIRWTEELGEGIEPFANKELEKQGYPLRTKKVHAWRGKYITQHFIDWKKYEKMYPETVVK